MPYLKDPKSKEPSVSLTLLAVTFTLTLVAIGLEIFGQTKTTSGALELFYACGGLYFGRRFASKSGAVIEPQEEKK